MLKSQQAAHEDQLRLQSEHISKLKQVIESKTEMNTSLDLQNQQLTTDLSKLRGDQSEAQAELNRLKLLHQEQLHTLQLELLSKQQDFAMDFQQAQSQHDRERNRLEKENRRTQKQFEQIRDQVKDKERSVKIEIERVLTEWEDRCTEMEQREREALSKYERSAAAEKKLQGDCSALQRETRALKAALDDRTDELKIIQSKYEERLESKEQEKVELKAL